VTPASGEIFEHHRRLREAIAELTTALSGGSAAGHHARLALPAVESAWLRIPGDAVDVPRSPEDGERRSERFRMSYE